MNVRWGDFIEWRDNIYLPGLTKLIDYFMEKLRNGTLLGIAPFLGIIYSILKGEKHCGLRCGSGISSFR